MTNEDYFYEETLKRLAKGQAMFDDIGKLDVALKFILQFKLQYLEELASEKTILEFPPVLQDRLIKRLGNKYLKLKGKI